MTTYLVLAYLAGIAITFPTVADDHPTDNEWPAAFTAILVAGCWPGYWAARALAAVRR